MNEAVNLDPQRLRLNLQVYDHQHPVVERVLDQVELALDVPWPSFMYGYFTPKSNSNSVVGYWL
jgi:hypothetical protein